MVRVRLHRDDDPGIKPGFHRRFGRQCLGGGDRLETSRGRRRPAVGSQQRPPPTEAPWQRWEARTETVSAGRRLLVRISPGRSEPRAPASGQPFRPLRRTNGRLVQAARAPLQAVLASARVLQGSWRRAVPRTWRFDHAPLR